MIYNRVDSKSYKEEFKKRFDNFGEKAPIMLSYAIDDLGVTIVHENTGTSYFYDWDFSINVKSMIHKIKQDLSNNHYPRISREVDITEELTAEEQADLLAAGTPIDQIPSSRVIHKLETYRIDKIIAMKDEFVLVDEATLEQYCYKMQSSSIFFLKNYREGKYASLLEAGEAFFKKSVLLNKLNLK